ncbi:glutaredoxin family protein [Nitrosomonas aestuarii]|uniref:glutaredoxin family protein n=1 Tax=Nitrosomonas aestuarii TaxID=52441 RepID=UPI001FD5F731|nr:glutaredoxin domain-containing protein [Nitrosomonas aestuarii]
MVSSNFNMFHAARRRFLFFLTLWSCLLALLLSAQTLTADNIDNETDFVTHEHVLEVFVRDGCPHCAKAKEFLSKLHHERPWLRIVYYSVDHDLNARNDLLQYTQAAGVWPPGVPTFRFNGQLVVGFDTPDQTGAVLVALIDQTAIESSDAEMPLFEILNVERLGLPVFTLAIGLLDGFNPCAMWVLLFLLSLLVHLQDRKRMALIAGTFVLASGVVYYAFMAAWLNIFLVIGFSAALRWTLGGLALAIGGLNVKDFFAWQQGFSLSIPASAKPGLYQRMRAVLAVDRLLPSMMGVVMLAVLVNFIELLCTAGFPAIYTAILAQQDLNPVSYYAYLGLYILGYVADDALMVAIAVVALSNRKLTERTGRWLKLVSGTVMLGLGCVLILRPELLI